MSKFESVSARTEQPQSKQSATPEAGGRFSFGAMLGAAFAGVVIAGLFAGAAHNRELVQAVAAVVGALAYLITDRRA